MIPTATYRIQFHRGFTFADAEAIIPYLADLGISHLYASPITVAQPGSSHGYDVVDPTRINPELGGEEGFRSLVAALKRKGMGAIIDIVPNHMGVAGQANGWWQDVLANGPSSRFAPFFDIDWGEKLLLPFLGDPLAKAIDEGALELRRDPKGLAIWAYGTHLFPLRPEDQEAAPDSDLAALLDRQHYRLDWWRVANDRLNWRRFFTITELAGLRVEDPQVFEETHRLYFRLFDEGLIDGVRIDHVDGLTDPDAYLDRLRERMPGAYIVVEKILAAGELMPPWPIEGTSGYDFMEEVTALLHDPAGEEQLTRYWAGLSGRPADFEWEEVQARRDMLDWEFEGQLGGCVRAFEALAGSAEATRAFTTGMLRRAIRALLFVFPAYRTYGTGASSPGSDSWIRSKARQRAAAHCAPGEMAVLDAVLDWLAGTGPGEPRLAAEAVRRFQQLSAPIAAKAVEDTAFYRYGRLLSRNDVGFDPGRFALSPGAFHEAMEARARDWPDAMLATATHDHKKGEDVRARLAALSACPEEWIAAAERWRKALGAAGEAIDPGDTYGLFQMMVGAWPPGLAADDQEALAGFGDRIADWQQKAFREAKLRSSWTQPDEAYEASARRLVGSILADPALSGDIAAFAERIRAEGEANGLVQTLLRCTVPGVPDLYQGAEFADLSLVDPDNRGPVDFKTRAATLKAGDAQGFDATKQRMIATLLRLRRAFPMLWREGSYEPLPIEGAHKERRIAFLRRHEGRALLALAALAPRRGSNTCRLTTTGSGAGDTLVRLPGDLDAARAFTILGECQRGSPLAPLLSERSPVHLILFLPESEALPEGLL